MAEDTLVGRCGGWRCGGRRAVDWSEVGGPRLRANAPRGDGKLLTGWRRVEGRKQRVRRLAARRGPQRRSSAARLLDTKVAVTVQVLDEVTVRPAGSEACSAAAAAAAF